MNHESVSPCGIYRTATFIIRANRKLAYRLNGIIMAVRLKNWYKPERRTPVV